jgi:mono/diheme cytochrome c family protein
LHLRQEHYGHAHRREIPIVVCCSLLCLAAASGERGSAWAQTGDVAVTRVRPTAAIDGASQYRAYCVQCHGVSGRGDGPAASSLETKVADLTSIAARNGGVFPSTRVLRFIDGKDRPGGRLTYDTELGRIIVKRGDERDEMPPWGVIFDKIWRTEGATMNQVRLQNLASYVKTLQKSGS